MKRHTLPVLALLSATLLLSLAFATSPSDTFGSRGLFAAQGHQDARYAFPVLAAVLVFGAWRVMPRRGVAAVLVVALSFAVVGCASSSSPPATSPPVKAEAETSCVSSSWLYAWIVDGRCTPDGTPDRITWPEWWALQLADNLAELREP